MFYLKKRRLRRVMATVFKHITGEPNIIHVHSAHVTRKIQIRHKGILSIKVSKHWHCQMNSPMSVVFRDRCGMRCSEMTQPEVILCEGTRMELMNSPGASFASRFNVAGKKTPTTHRSPLGNTLCFPAFKAALPPMPCAPQAQQQRGTHQNVLRNSMEDPGSTIRDGLHLTTPSSPTPPGRAALGSPRAARDEAARRSLGCEGDTEPRVGDPGPRCKGSMAPV